MLPGWSLRKRMPYQLWLGGLLAVNSICAWILQGPVAVIGLVLGGSFLIAGLVTRDKFKREQAATPAPPAE